MLDYPKGMGGEEGRKGKERGTYMAGPRLEEISTEYYFLYLYFFSLLVETGFLFG